MEAKFGSYLVTGVDAPREAGRLFEIPSDLWEQAALSELRSDAVYMDGFEETAIVAIRPKPAFPPLSEIATP